MSKLAKKPIVIPQGVEAKIADGVLEFSGKEGKVSVKIIPYVGIEIKDGQITLKLEKEIKQARANIGTLASLIKNAIAGVTGGFTKHLELEGIGFKAALEGANLVLNVGFSHPIKFTPPAGIKIVVEKSTIKVSGVDRQLVGLTASQIRKIFPPEPYKGKGIRYQGEVVRRKEGKKVAGATAAA
ncbi:MAG: large subunit ribosomal protein L6 [Parcubacteria group bacterium Gr01-1014_19]|nr:MAG: large subunit ribosomal protein L6 [Parcubacteria group bacterium Gr01-1014_19]